MPITPTTFSHSKSLAATSNFRAYADVVVTKTTGKIKKRSPTFQCLVDTGSDYTILPMSATTTVGINLTGQTVTFRTAGGASYSLPYHPRVNLIVQGYAITVPVAFSNASAFSPILGRLELLVAFDVGFDINNWYWG